MVEEIKQNSEVFSELDEEDENTNDLKQVDMSEDVFGELSDKPKYEKVLKDGDENKIYTIIKAEERKPYVKDSQGKQVPAKQMSKEDVTKLGYPSSLSLFLKDTDYIVNLSGLTYYLSKVNGKNVYTPWFQQKVTEDMLDDQYTSVLSKIFFKYCKFKKLDIKKVTGKQFKEGLIGLKVKLKNKKGKYLGKEYVKIEVVDFVE